MPTLTRCNYLPKMEGLVWSDDVESTVQVPRSGAYCRGSLPVREREVFLAFGMDINYLDNTCHEENEGFFLVFF